MRYERSVRWSAIGGAGFVLATAVACASVAPTASPLPSSIGAASQSPAADDPLLGDWRAEPEALDADRLASLRFLCANAGEPEAQAAMKDLPVAVVDVRGAGIATMVLADEHLAYDCRTKIEPDGRTFTILEQPSRLDPAAVDPAADAEVHLVGQTSGEDEQGERTVLIGRVGPAASRVRVRVDDGTDVAAATGNGWFVAWWPGAAPASAVESVDASGGTLGSASNPDVAVEGRVGPASWWLDPAAPAPAADSRTIDALVRERACTSGRPPGDRLLEPEIFLSDDAVIATFLVRRLPGPQDCVGNQPEPTEFILPDPIGDRRLLDGSEVPPRNASIAP